MDNVITLTMFLAQLPLLLEKRLVAIKLYTFSPTNKGIPCQESSLSERGSPLSLPQSSQLVLGQHIASLPPGQATDVLQTHITHVQGFIHDLVSLSSTTRSGMDTTNTTSVSMVTDDGSSKPSLSSRMDGVDGFLPVKDETEHEPALCSVSIALLRCVEALSIVLRHMPRGVWVAGRCRERAGKLLATLVEDVSAMLMGVAEDAPKASYLETVWYIIGCDVGMLRGRMDMWEVS